MTRLILVVARKELTELLRDRRTLLFLVVLPVLLYPLLMLLFARAGEAGIKSLEAQPVVVERAGPLPRDVDEALSALRDVELISPGTSRIADAVVRTAPPAEPDDTAPVVVEIDRAREIAGVVDDRVVAALRRAREEARDGRVAAWGVPPEQAAVADVLVVDTSTKERRGGFLFGRIAAPLIVFMLIMGAFTPASDATAGERERQTLRTLLCTPVDARVIALGKLLSTSIIAIGAALANLVGLVMTLRSGLGEGVSLHVSIFDVVPILAVLLPTAVYVAALLLAGAAFARSTKEAQAMLTPAVLIVGMPAFGVALPGVPASPAVAMIPVFGPALVLREVFAGTATPLLVAAGALGAVALLVVAVALAARAFTVEALMSGRVPLPARVPGPLPPFDGVLVAMGLFSGAIFVSAIAGRAGAAQLLVATQVLVFAGLPLAVAAARSTTPRAALGLVLPTGRGWPFVAVGALLVVPSLLSITEKMATSLAQDDPALLEQMKVLSDELTALPLPLLAVLIILLPAVCEELAFRGALLRAWAGRPVVAVVASAALFAALHGSLARVPPTLAIGLLAGFVAIFTRSTWPAMAVHALHNGSALVGALLAGEALTVEAALAEGAAPPWWVHAVAVAGVASIAVGLRRGTSPRDGTAP